MRLPQLLGRAAEADVPDRVEDLPDPSDQAAARRSPDRRHTLVVLLASVLLGLTVWIGTSLRSPLPIGAVEVVGASPDLVPAVLTSAGVAPDQPFRSVDADAVSERVATVEGVESARLSWGWPDRLLITIEQQPVVAAEALPSGGYAVLDPDGTAVRTSPEQPVGLVLVKGSDSGRRLTALAVAAALPAEWVPQIALVSAASPDGVTITLVSGQSAVLGSTEEVVDKLRLVGQLMPTGAKVIDVSLPARPALRDLPAPPKP